MAPSFYQNTPLVKESALLEAPREVRDMITEEVILAQGRPYILSPKYFTTVKEKMPTSEIAESDLVSSQRIGMGLANRQLRTEVNHIIRFTAFRSSAAMILQVYNLDMRRVARFVRALSPREIARATQNESIQMHFINYDQNLAIANGRASMVEWTHLCESLGLRVWYVANWTTSSIVPYLSGLRSSREGRKILDVLDVQTVQAWKWDKFVASSRL